MIRGLGERMFRGERVFLRGSARIRDHRRRNETVEGPRFNVNFRFDMTIIPLRSLSLSLSLFLSHLVPPLATRRARR